MNIKEFIGPQIRKLSAILLIVSALVFTYLIALNGRYMYVNMDGDDLVVDKWTRTIYVNYGKPELTRMSDVIKIRAHEEYRKKHPLPGID